MKFCLSLAALIAFWLAGQCDAAERPLISLTDVRGYVYTAGRWQPHACRTLAVARTRRVLQISPNGAPREIGHTIRCHHGDVFVPGAGGRIMSAPNRSSRLAPPPARRTRVILVEVHTDRFELPDVQLPRPPHQGGPSSSVIPGTVIETDPEFLLIVLEDPLPLRSTRYRLPPPPLFPRLRP
jgi:hypothetical protein